jgi:hypothetical protein
MRLFRGMLMSVAMVGLLACSDSNEPGDGDGDGDGGGDTINATYTLATVDGEDASEFDASGELDFNSDGTATFTFDLPGDENDVTVEGDYEIDGDDVTFSNEDGEMTGVFSDNRNTLTVDDDGTELVFEK